MHHTLLRITKTSKRNKNNLIVFPIVLLIHFEPLKNGQPLYKMADPKGVLCSEAPLYM